MSAMTRLELVIFIVCLLLVIAGAGVSVGSCVGLEQAFMAALTAALVYVTATYAFFTFRIVRISDRQARIMSEAQVNSAAPVVMLEASYNEEPSGVAISVSWKNIGKGPALNFRCWVEDGEHPDLRVPRKAICRTAIEVALSESMPTGFIYTEIPGYRLGVGYIRAQYESIFNRTYESCLLYSENAAPELKYGEATERIIL